jgi:hypothetical protein
MKIGSLTHESTPSRTKWLKTQLGTTSRQNETQTHDIFKQDKQTTKSKSLSGKHIQSDNNGNKNNDNKSTSISRNIKQIGTNDDIVHKIKKKSTQQTISKKFVAKSTKIIKNDHRVQKQELHNWITSRLGRATYKKHQIGLNKQAKDLIDKHKVAEKEQSKIEATERKDKFQLFYKTNIYNHHEFKAFVKETIANKRYAHLYQHSQRIQESSNYYDPLFQNTNSNNNDQELDSKTTICFNKTMTKPIQNNKTSSTTMTDDMDDIEYLNQCIAEVEAEKAQNKFQSKTEIMNKFRNKDNITDTNDSQGNQESWTVITNKATAREHRNTFEEVSNKFLPINLPLFESEVYDKSDTKYIIPITVNIRTKRGNPQSIKNSRLLVAILTALQMAFQDTYIGELSGNISAPTIAHHLNVPLDDKSVKKYMMEPESGMNNTISTKIVIHTNNDIKSYLANPKLRKYLSNENISIEVNTLSAIAPHNVGIIE